MRPWFAWGLAVLMILVPAGRLEGQTPVVPQSRSPEQPEPAPTFLQATSAASAHGYAAPVPPAPQRSRGALRGALVGLVAGGVLGGLSATDDSDSNESGIEGTLAEGPATAEGVVLGALVGAVIGAALGATVFAPDGPAGESSPVQVASSPLRGGITVGIRFRSPFP